MIKIGRYVTGDFNYKFWFGVQSSSDIEEFGGESITTPQWSWSKKELDDIKKKVSTLKKDFKNKHKMTYKQFMNKMRKKGCTLSSDDKETETKKWESMCKDASKIDLGEHIIKALKNEEYIEVSY